LCDGKLTRQTWASSLPTTYTIKPCTIKATELNWTEISVQFSSGTSLFTRLRATERQLSYGITQCYLPPDTGERAPP